MCFETVGVACFDAHVSKCSGFLGSWLAAVSMGAWSFVVCWWCVLIITVELMRLVMRLWVGWLMLVLDRQLVRLCGLTLLLFVEFLLKLTDLGMGIMKAGVGKLSKIVHSGVDEVMNLDLFELGGVWVGDGDALLVTVGCCYFIQVHMLIS